MANLSFRIVFSQIHKRFLQSSAAALSSTSPLTSSSPFTVDFLVKQCGLPLESAVSVSNKCQLNEKNPQKPQSVLQFLKSHHFSDSQVAKLIIKYPRILRSNVKNNLQPKFDYLVKIGFEGELLPQFIISNPFPMVRSLDSKIKPCIEFLRPLLGSDKNIAVAIMRSRRLFTCNLKSKLQPNVDFLTKEGVSPHYLGIFILQSRGIFRRPESLIYAVNTVKNLGFEPTAPLFIRALIVVMSMSQTTWKKKIGFMKSMGWNEQEIFSAFKRNPYYLALSEKKIKSALEFYLTTMKLNPKNVIDNPVLLGLSIEKRIRPRYNVLKVLESEKLIKGIKRLHLLIPEKEFQKKFVDPYIPRAPGLYEMYLGTMESRKIGS